MKLHKLNPIWLVFLLAFVSLACNLVSNLGEGLGGARSTAQAVATEIQGGRDLLGTARVVATEVGGSGLLQTAQVFATQAGESGLLETAQAFATEAGPGLVETAKAFATEAGPGLMETAQAAITQASGAFGEAPGDIPLVGGDRQNFFANETTVSYSTSMPFNEVVGFYTAEMPANGWEAREEGKLVTDQAAVLPFGKPDRDANVTISRNPADGGATVAILLTPK